jgi:hypothetical protein
MAELRAAILDSQRRGQSYRDSTRRAMAAGVQGYIAFLRGQRVTYWARGGEQHTEWFPGAGLPNHNEQGATSSRIRPTRRQRQRQTADA